MIRVDAAWFAVEPLDMRAGVDTALARVVSVFGEARAHHAYLFVNKRANRMKVLVHDGFGLWLCARRLYEGSFIRAGMTSTIVACRSRMSNCRRSWWDCRGSGSMSARRSACCEKKVLRSMLMSLQDVAASRSMELPREWAQMDAEELRDLTATLIAAAHRARAQLNKRDAELSAHEAQLASRDEELKRKQLKIDQLTHEMAILKRWRYARRSEQLDAVQRSLLDESIDADLEAIGLEIEALRG